FLDTKDATSTSNMSTHVKLCWGNEIFRASQAAGKHHQVRPMVKVFSRTGTITQAFKRSGKGKVTYSTRQLTSKETWAWIVRWVAENKRPYDTVKDRAFLTLMKMGRPEYKIPSPATVSRDVRRMFARCHARVTRMLQDYNGELNFMFDAWMSPNHKALLAFAVHLQHQGNALSFILDVIEVAE
ncbi:hypothetical protein L226DRAFT_425154, partial [Lentinus tigrinus ALCF2SS1-7]